MTNEKLTVKSLCEKLARERTPKCVRARISEKQVLRIDVDNKGITLIEPCFIYGVNTKGLGRILYDSFKEKKYELSVLLIGNDTIMEDKYKPFFCIIKQNEENNFGELTQGVYKGISSTKGLSKKFEVPDLYNMDKSEVLERIIDGSFPIGATNDGEPIFCNTIALKRGKKLDNSAEHIQLRLEPYFSLANMTPNSIFPIIIEKLGIAGLEVKYYEPIKNP